MGDMNVIVCVKQIPDPAAPGALDGATNTLKRDGKLILDDSDAYGVEMALQLVDKAGGGEVSLVSMAPNNETSGLRTALAMGAAKGVLISDPALQGSDALTTAKVLAAAITRLGGADLQTVTPEQCQNKLLNCLVFLQSLSQRKFLLKAAY
jgi:electron transfer flavoprotein beta subunit